MFFLRLLQGDRLARADRNRGRFRNYLLTALDRFLINEWIKDGRQKRGGGLEFVTIPCGEGTPANAVEPVDPGTAELQYDRQWASVVMSRALQRLKRSYPGDRARLLEALQPFVWGDKAGCCQAEVAASLGLSEGAARTAVHRLRKAYRDCLRAELAPTVSSTEELDGELRHLIRVVSQAWP